MIPCLIFEDDHLLAINKPAGLNTHSPSPFAGEGIYDWLRHREPRWAGLAIIHRLDKETSGVMVFAKTPLASSSLTGQFTRHEIRKQYVFLTARDRPQKTFSVSSRLARLGDKYASVTTGGGQEATTRFAFTEKYRNWFQWAAWPQTGRTHQIRVHAAQSGLSILGDVLYGGAASARAYLHAWELTLQHPATGKPLTLRAPIDWDAHPAWQLRAALIDPAETDAFRLLHGAADGCPGWYVDRLGSWLLSQSEAALSGPQKERLAGFQQALGLPGACHKPLLRNPRQIRDRVLLEDVVGNPAPEEWVIRENGLRFTLRRSEGYSVGLFLDQRDNRRRLLANHVAAGFPVWPAGLAQARVLNTFAYTCGFSLCAARAGARTVNVDLSRKYLEWGRNNWLLNGIDTAGHEFLHGDVFDWLRRLAKKQNLFEIILLDPPTFSSSKASGRFQVEADCGKLVRQALPLLRPGGVLFVSANAAGFTAEKFLAAAGQAVKAAGRTVAARHYVPQPPDFPVCRAEPAYLKTVWLRVA